MATKTVSSSVREIGRSSIKRNKGYNGGLKRKPSVGPTWLEAGEKEKLAGREENEHGYDHEKRSGNSRARPCPLLG